MESKKINQLATNVSPQTSDLTIIGDPTTGVSKKITLLQIANLFATTGTVTSVGVTETGDALTITGSPITTAGTINIGFAGAATQYVRGDGALADFPTSTGGGSSVSYYLNSSVSQGTIGGVAYRELSKDPIIGAGTDITISADGYIASYITDANDPALLEVPGGNFNCEFYFSVNSNAHNPYVYAELYKYDGSTFTLLGSSQSVPEYLSNGTTLSPYYFAIPVAASALTITDRLAVRIYANVDTKVVTLHTENSHLCQVVTTFSKGLTTLNSLTRQTQFFATGTSGTDFNIVSSVATHTFNIPDASATNRGLITTGSQTIAGDKTINGNTDFVGNSNFSGYAIFSNAIPTQINYGAKIAKGSVPATFGSDAVNLYSDATTNNIIFRDNLSIAKLLFNNSTQTFTFPAASGTIALVGGSGVGTVTSVAALTLGTTGTDLSSSVANGTTTPVITLNVPTASATNRGALSSADWTTFNNKQSALTNPVTGTGTTNYISKFTGTSTIGNSLIFDNGTNVGIGNTNTSYTLDVTGTGRFTGALRVDHSTAVAYGAVIYNTSATGQGLTVRGGSTSSQDAFNVQTYDGNKSLLSVQGGGNVGIGMTPDVNLQVKAISGNTTTFRIGPSASGFELSQDNGGFTVCTIKNIYGSTSASAELALKSGFLTFYSGTSLTERMRITSGGNTQPGTDNAYSLGVSGTRWSAVWAANGTIQTSDEKEKKDIIDADLGLDFISKLRPVSFKWKVGQNIVTSEVVKDEEGNPILDEEGNEKTESVIVPRKGKRTHYGLIAQEVEELLDGKDFGGFIHDEETDTKGLRYDQFIPLLIKSIQEQQVQIEELKAIIAAK
jgi:hypothetical protein